MASPFVESVHNQKASPPVRSGGTEENSDSMSDAELQLIQDAVRGEKEEPRKASRARPEVQKAKRSVKADAKPRKKEAPASQAKAQSVKEKDGNATPSTVASEAFSSVSNAEEDLKEVRKETCPKKPEDDAYHKPSKKKSTHAKQVPWVWIVLVIIITAALLYSWYDYTKSANSRKDVRAFVAAIVIVVAAISLYVLVK